MSKINIKFFQKLNWVKVSVIANITIISIAIIGFAGNGIIRQSDVNPEFCASCHPMDANVQSYMDSNHLDNVHMQAGVQCKECHDYPLQAEIASGINYILGNYEIVSIEDQRLAHRQFGDEMCFQCHISAEYLANQTDFLRLNPHLSHWANLSCNECHISHGDQIDYCSNCHSNGGQRMTGGEILPRADNPWESGEGSADAPSH